MGFFLISIEGLEIKKLTAFGELAMDFVSFAGGVGMLVGLEAGKPGGWDV